MQYSILLLVLFFASASAFLDDFIDDIIDDVSDNINDQIDDLFECDPACDENSEECYLNYCIPTVDSLLSCDPECEGAQYCSLGYCLGSICDDCHIWEAEQCVEVSTDTYECHGFFETCDDDCAYCYYGVCLECSICDEIIDETGLDHLDLSKFSEYATLIQDDDWDGVITAALMEIDPELGELAQAIFEGDADSALVTAADLTIGWLETNAGDNYFVISQDGITVNVETGIINFDTTLNVDFAAENAEFSFTELSLDGVLTFTGEGSVSMPAAGVEANFSVNAMIVASGGIALEGDFQDLTLDVESPDASVAVGAEVSIGGPILGLDGVLTIGGSAFINSTFVETKLVVEGDLEITSPEFFGAQLDLSLGATLTVHNGETTTFSELSFCADLSVIEVYVDDLAGIIANNETITALNYASLIVENVTCSSFVVKDFHTGEQSTIGIKTDYTSSDLYSFRRLLQTDSNYDAGCVFEDTKLTCTVTETDPAYLDVAFPQASVSAASVAAGVAAVVALH